MRIALATLMIAHGIAHLARFAIPWRLAPRSGAPVRTTVLDGRIDIGEGGVRALGSLWLALAMAFCLAALGAFAATDWWLLVAFLAALVSMMLCLLEWPQARFGVGANLLVLGGLAAGTLVRAFSLV